MNTEELQQAVPTSIRQTSEYFAAWIMTREKFTRLQLMLINMNAKPATYVTVLRIFEDEVVNAQTCGFCVNFTSTYHFPHAEVNFNCHRFPYTDPIFRCGICPIEFICQGNEYLAKRTVSNITEALECCSWVLDILFDIKPVVSSGEGSNE